MLCAWDCVGLTHYSQCSQFPNNVKEEGNVQQNCLIFLIMLLKTSSLSSAVLSGSLESNSDLHLLKCSLLKIRSKLLSAKQLSFI